MPYPWMSMSFVGTSKPKIGFVPDKSLPSSKSSPPSQKIDASSTLIIHNVCIILVVLSITCVNLFVGGRGHEVFYQGLSRRNQSRPGCRSDRIFLYPRA